jgi:hypothetical protein
MIRTLMEKEIQGLLPIRDMKNSICHPLVTHAPHYQFSMVLVVLDKEDDQGFALYINHFHAV